LVNSRAEALDNPAFSVRLSLCKAAASGDACLPERCPSYESSSG
jgi:hypothetical protein